jgi:hypothetical protein
MQDPHVEALYYDVGSLDNLPFDNPPAVTVTNHLGQFEVSAGKLTVRPAEHYASGEEARVVIEPFLRAWEITSDLSRGVGAIRFKLLSVRKIDRTPPPRVGGLVSLAAGTGTMTVTGFPVTITISQRTYPPPPIDFRTTPEVEIAFSRWRAFRDGREPLQSMAYAVLTLVQSVAGGRREASTTFRIEARVLATIAELSSTRGNVETLRKFKQGAKVQPLTGAESTWLEAAVRGLVQRMGQHAAGIRLPRLTMPDLPTL